MPKIRAEEGNSQQFTEVLLVSDEGDTKVGSPTVEGASVSATVVGHGRDKKIVVFKMKRRKTYRNRNGHRQDYTEIQIEDIVLPN